MYFLAALFFRLHVHDEGLGVLSIIISSIPRNFRLQLVLWRRHLAHVIFGAVQVWGDLFQHVSFDRLGLIRYEVLYHGL